MYRRIVLAYDGSPGARAALHHAVALAGAHAAVLTVVAVEAHLPQFPATVGEVQEEHESEERDCRRWLKEAVAHADEHGVRTTTMMRAGHAPQAILHVARQVGADLVVVGHSGHSRAWGRFLGSTTEKVSRHAPCSVLIVRDDKDHPGG
jgi:nucleotide-binding universal stress UspA family protein